VTGDLMPMESAGRALRGMAAELVEDLKQPAARAGFCTSLLTSALLARRLGMLPTIVIALMVGVSVEHLYGMAEDIHGALTLTNPVQLLFHGVVGCQGHEPDEPWTKECPDATSEV
jgi:hypothetical protein